MIRMILYAVSQIVLVWVVAYSCQTMGSQMIYQVPLILFIILNDLALIAFYLKDPGYLTISEQTQTNKSKMALSTPQSQPAEHQYSTGIKSHRSKKKVLNSSLVIYKNRFQNIHDKQDRECYSQDNIDPDQLQQSPHLPNDRSSKSVVYIEQPQCSVCYILQPLRAKHCKKCGRCVATYDHHNLITYRCVGEKNKLVYITQSALQLCLLVSLLANSLECFTVETWTLTFLQQIIVLIQLFLIFLIIALFMLLVYHLFLIITNQTLYEHQYKDRITQLKSVAEDNIRPFSEGLLRNCIQFFKTSHSKHFNDWKLDS